MTYSEKAKAVEALQSHINTTFPATSAITVTDQLLLSYLDDTSGSGISEAERLIMLAFTLWGLKREIEGGWSGISKIFKSARAQEPENFGILASWTAMALQFGITETHTTDYDLRIMAADDTEDMLKEEQSSDPDNYWLAQMLGLLYLNHPRRRKESQSTLETAERWLRKAEALDREGDQTVKMHLADCLYEQARWQEAAAQYRSINRNELAEMADGATAARVQSRIDECEEKTSN